MRGGLFVVKQGCSETMQVALTYMGAVIGAGFASGQEAVRFFLIFGYKGLWGIVLATILLAGSGALTLRLTRTQGINHYLDLLNLVLGKKWGRLADVCLTAFLWVGLAIMLAGSGSVFAEHLGASASWGIALTALIVAVVLLGGVDRVLWLNVLAVPILAGITLMVVLTGLTRPLGSIGSLAGEMPPLILGNTWWLSSLLYVAYNLMIGTVLLASLAKRAREAGGILGGLGMGALLMGMTIVLSMHYPDVSRYEVPMLYVAGVRFPWLRNAYAVALWLAMGTTAVANGYGLAKRLASRHLSYPLAVVVVIAVSLPLTRYGFARMVGSLYPLFGYVGLVLMLCMGFRVWRNTRS